MRPARRSAPTPEEVWAVLGDVVAYPDWDSGVERVEGQLAPGEKLKVFSKVSPGRAFPVKVVEFEPGARMTWRGGMPLGLFKGVRTYHLVPGGAGETRFDDARAVQRAAAAADRAFDAGPAAVVRPVRPRPESARGEGSRPSDMKLTPPARSASR